MPFSLAKPTLLIAGFFVKRLPPAKAEQAFEIGRAEQADVPRDFEDRKFGFEAFSSFRRWLSLTAVSSIAYDHAKGVLPSRLGCVNQLVTFCSATGTKEKRELSRFGREPEPIPFRPHSYAEVGCRRAGR